MLPAKVRVVERITQINYKPSKVAIKQENSLHIQWEIDSFHCQRREILGPMLIESKENGKKKFRYSIRTFEPEKIIQADEKTLAFLKQCQEEGNMKAKLNLSSGPTSTSTYLKNLGKTAAISFAESLQYCPEKDLRREIGLESMDAKTSSAEKVEYILKSMTVVDKRCDAFYQSKYMPWVGLSEDDLKNKFWKKMHGVLGFKKLVVKTLTCDFDPEQYKEIRRSKAKGEKGKTVCGIINV